MHLLYTSKVPNLDISNSLKIVEIAVSVDMFVSMVVKYEQLPGIGGNYSTQLLLDNIIIAPDRTVPVAPVLSSFIVQSRSVIVRAGEKLEYYTRGLSGDTNVTITVSIMDVSPISGDQLVQDIEGDLIARVVNAIGQHEFIIQPTKTVLGPCKQPVVKTPKVLNNPI